MGVPIECGAGDHLGPALSALLAYVVAGIPLLLAVAFAVWRTVHHARIADRYRKLIAPGQVTAPVRGVQGKVVLDEGIPFAARVELEQRGKTWKQKRNVYHSWTETGRRVDVRPFRLRTDDGVLVQVEAGPGALLCMPFRRSTGDNDERAIVAELHNHEHVIVVGRVFERGGERTSSVYRGETSPRVLVRSPSGGRMVVSTRPIDAAFRSRMWLHIKWLGIAAGTAAIVHGGLLVSYHARQLLGEPTTATVASKHSVRGSKSTTYYVETRAASGKYLPEQSASLSCYQQVGPGDEVDVILVGDESAFAQLGRRPTANFMLLLGACGAALAVAFIYRRQLRTKGPWYLRNKVDMRGDGPTNPDELPEA